GLEQRPSRGQSETTPPVSFGCTPCQRNLPVFSSKHMTTPRSIALPVFGSTKPAPFSRGFWLLVPTKTRPSATTGPPYALEPSPATHRILLAMSLSFLSTHFTGSPLTAVLAMLRAGVPPYMVQS